MHFHKCDACSLLSFILGKKLFKEMIFLTKMFLPEPFLWGKLKTSYLNHSLQVLVKFCDLFEY